MADRWQVREGTQVQFGGKLHGPGDSFSATEDEVVAARVDLYVEKVRQQAAPKADNKAQQAPTPHAVRVPGPKVASKDAPKGK